MGDTRLRGCPGGHRDMFDKGSDNDWPSHYYACVLILTDAHAVPKTGPMR